MAQSSGRKTLKPRMRLGSCPVNRVLRWMVKSSIFILINKKNEQGGKYNVNAMQVIPIYDRRAL
jgi:hypothetical protein